MPDRVIFDKDIIELELENVPTARGGKQLRIRIIKGGGTESKIYLVEVTDSLLGSTIADKLSEIRNDFIYWLLRRLFVKRYQEKGKEINELIGLGSGNYESMIGITVSKDEALLILLRMIRMFVEDNSERPIDILEFFLSCELHFNVIQNAINDASKLHNLIKRRGDNQVYLVEGRFDALKDKIIELENRDSVKPIKFFHEVEITLTPPFGFLLFPFKDKKGFKHSDYKDHIIPYIKDNHDIQYVNAIHESSGRGMAEFQSWFNASDDLNQATVSGYWDMALHILTPSVCKYIDQPDRRTALEIGYGGGRILNAACDFFGHVYGVDIHLEQSVVEDFFRSNNRSNFTLLNSRGNTIDLPSESIDLVYSFIVLQHLEYFKDFVIYLEETLRLLRSGGVAQLYFGSFGRLPLKGRVRLFFTGYKEIPDALVNHTSLLIRTGHAVSIAKSMGFKVVDRGHSYKRVPDGFPDITGGQNYITLLKP